MTSSTERFLSGIRHPVNRSNLITALAAGTVMQVDRLPVDLLPTVVLLAVIGVRRYQQQIVDDYTALLHRTRDVICAADVARVTPEGEKFDHPEFHIVSALVLQFMDEEANAVWLDDLPEAWYMIAAYEELMNLDVKDLFEVKK